MYTDVVLFTKAPSRGSLGVSVAALFAVSAGSSQHHEMKPPAEKPVALYQGLGAWRHPISTKSADAQKFFDQGLALLYGFNPYEVLRSFRRASELDPSAAMAYWGMADRSGSLYQYGWRPELRSEGRVHGSGIRTQALGFGVRAGT